MIIVRTNAPAAVGPVALGHGRAEWHCLARRGMLHSECESFDHLRLPPGRRVEHDPADGVEQAVLVLSGTAVTGEGEGERTLGAGHLVLLGHGGALTVRAGAEGLEALTLRLMPRSVSAALPQRVPELPEAERALGAEG
ncbi:pirin-like C-terminal cupin domain-containing protein [Nocardiopsis sp. FIRDI 009]|uniref:pirin-like C-terminal cupin domain-containing protein n=1 Tax=Nocardiopsis sp. FIRDI 009 TaxID=714197 RepID=UPI000E26C37D|nr:pirin-like C-terminal cupin domain-containing protein [Nocardiopsis sp. FIRDI 009]